MSELSIYIPLKQPAPEGNPDAVTQDEVYNVIAGAAEGGDANEALPPIDQPLPEAGQVPDENAAFVETAREIVTDVNLDKFQVNKSLYDLRRLKKANDQAKVKAQTALAAIEEEKAKNAAHAYKNRIISDGIINQEILESVLKQTEEETNKPFAQGEIFETGETGERVFEFVASEISPTGWIKSGHADPALFIGDVVPELEVTTGDYFVLGSTLKEARDVIQNLPPEDRAYRAQQVGAMINNVAGTFGTDNKFEVDRLNTLFRGMFGTAEDYDAARFTTTEQVINIATAGIGGAVLRTVSRARRLASGVNPDSPLAVAATIAPDTSRDLVQNALADSSEETARAMGTSRAQIADDYVAMNGPDDPILRGPDLAENADQVQEVTENLKELRSRHNFASDEEIRQATEALDTRLDTLNGVQLSKSAVSRDTDGSLRVNYTIAPEDAPEFASYNEARRFVDTRLNDTFMDREADILKFNTERREYELYDPETAGDDGVGGFLVQAEYRTSIAETAVPENVLRRQPNILTKYLDTSVSFIDRYAKSITNVENLSGSAERVLSDLMRPYRSANRRTQRQVSEVLEQGRRTRHEFTNLELEEIYRGNNDAIAAHKAHRTFYDIDHEMKNHGIRRSMQDEGYRELDFSLDQKAYLRPITEAETRPAHVYNTRTGRMEPTTPETPIYTSRTVLRFLDETGAESATRWVTTSPERLRPLSAQVLPKIPGYIGNHLDAKWLVKRRTTTSHGEDVLETVRFGNDNADLRDWVAEQESGDFIITPSRETADGEFTMGGNAALMADFEMLGHARHRTDLDQLNDSYQTHLLNPEEAIARDIQTLAKQVGIQDFTRYSVNKWNANYGDLSPNGQMPWGKFSPREDNTDDITRARIQEAKALQDRIKLMTGSDDETLSEMTRARMRQTASVWAEASITRGANPTERVGRVRSRLLRAGAKALDRASDVSATNVVKQANHLQFIVGNPGKQFVMQLLTSTLYAGVEGGIQYAASGKWASDVTYLTRAKLANSPEELDALATSFARNRNISVEEARRFHTDFEESGLIESISGHQFMEFASKNIIGSKLSAGSVKRGFEHGFRGGEAGNLINAYAIMRNRKISQTGRNVLTPEDVQDVIAEAKQIAGNMGSANKSALQQGLLGMTFQFTAHNVRMMQLFMPRVGPLENVAMPLLTTAERVRIGALYQMMWGTTGYAAYNLISDEADKDRIPENSVAREIIRKGMIGTGMEYMFEGLTQSDSDLNFSKDFAPLGGAFADFKVGDGRSSTPIGFIAERGHDVFFGNPIRVQDLLGVSGRAIDDPTGVFTDPYNLWVNPTFSLKEKVHVQASWALDIIPFFDNITQAQMAHNMGVWANSLGEPLVKATVAEQLAKLTLGSSPEGIDNLYSLKRLMNNSKRGSKNSSDWTRIRRAGATMAEAMHAALITLNNGDVPQKEFYSRIQAYNAMAKLTFDQPSEFNVYAKAMEDRANKIITASGTTLKQELINSLVTDKWLQGESSMDEMKKELYKMAPGPDRDWAIEKIELWFGAGAARGTDIDANQ